VTAMLAPARSPVPGSAWQRSGAWGCVAFRTLMKINHPAPGDVVRNPAHVAGYGTAFEGVISLRIRDDDGTAIAEGSTQGGSNGVIGEFKADLQFSRRPNQRLGVVEAFEESASGSGEELHLDRVPIVFG
jgi:immunoglobulin-like protein involved in spore germination